MKVFKIIKYRRRIRDSLTRLPFAIAGDEFATQWRGSPGVVLTPEPSTLEQYYDSNTEGPGIWKWRHYFDIYSRHLAKFVGRDVHVVEIGIFSGGSLGMWRHYFGSNAHIYGVDIESACKAYETHGVKVLIGDQQSREFWRDFKAQVPRVDVLIDDGGHRVMQQIVTLEEMLPHISPGGVFICEDIHDRENAFSTYCHALAAGLNNAAWTKRDLNGDELACATTDFQKAIASVSFYPFMTVIEKRERPIELSCKKHGTQWQPFYRK